MELEAVGIAATETEGLGLSGVVLMTASIGLGVGFDELAILEVKVTAGNNIVVNGKSCPGSGWLHFCVEALFEK